MEQTIINKRKTGIFIALALIFNSVVLGLLNTVFANFIGYEGSVYYRTQTINSATSALSSVLTLLIFFGFGYLLNKNIRKAAGFAGVLFTSKLFLGIITSLIGNIAEIIMLKGIITPSEMLGVNSIVSIVFIAVEIFVSYFIYTALEGVNPKFPCKSTEDNTMTLSQVKKRYVVVFIITVIASSAITTLANMLSAYLIAEGTENQLMLNITVDFSTWIANAAAIVILFAVMYKPNKSFIEAMRFFCTYALGIRLSSVIVAVIFAISNAVIYFTVSEIGNMTDEVYAFVVPIVGGVMSTLGVVLEFVFIFKLLKLYFTDEPKANEYQMPAEYNYDNYNIPSAEEREAQLQQKIDTIE